MAVHKGSLLRVLKKGFLRRVLEGSCRVLSRFCKAGVCGIWGARF